MPSCLEVVLLDMKGLLLWGILHLMLLLVAGNHGLLSGVWLGNQGINAGMSGIPPMTDGKLRLILLWTGPAPLSILGFEFGGFRFSPSRRSGMGVPLEGSLDRGGHSFSALVGVFSGYFIGEMK